MVVQVADVRRAYALAAKAFYGAQPKTCVAVTGTNGKTSVATFCRQIFAALGHTTASMGTLGVVRQNPDGTETAITPPGLTTPDAADMARHMAELAQDGVTHVALEASSHGIDQRRLDGVSLYAAGFTNQTQDHLDYHATMDAYRTAKLRLFEQLLPRGRIQGAGDVDHRGVQRRNRRQLLRGRQQGGQRQHQQYREPHRPTRRVAASHGDHCTRS